MAVKYLCLIVFVIGAAVAQTDDISGAVDNLPPELQGKINKDQVQEITNKTAQAFKEKCQKYGGPEAFDNVQSAGTNLQTCINGLVDRNVLDKEIEDAKPEGKVDEVFKKYCDKSPSFKNCFYNMTEAVKPCFSEQEKGHLKTIYNITEQLAEFVCYKGGDRIALFISEGGPDCIKAKQDDIQNCVNNITGTDAKFDPNTMSVDNLPTIAFDEKVCTQLTDLQKCVVGSLETCEQPTTANIVESLFKFARKATPCSKYPDPSEVKRNSASGLFLSSITVVTAYLATYLI